MKNPYRYLLPLLVIASCTGEQPQEEAPSYEEHHIERSGEPCTEFEDGDNACTTVNLSWLTFDDLPTLNDSILVRMKRMVVYDDDDPESAASVPLEQMVDNWFLELQQDAASNRDESDEGDDDFGVSWTWQISDSISVQNHRGSLLSLLEESYEFQGGAHGLPTIDYLHWDLDRDEEVTLNDLLVSEQTDSFWELTREAYVEWIEENDLGEDYLENWPFDSTDVFYFGDEGLVLVYNVYEIAPYAMGPQELEIPWTELEGMIKPDYQSLLR